MISHCLFCQQKLVVTSYQDDDTTEEYFCPSKTHCFLIQYQFQKYNKITYARFANRSLYYPHIIYQHDYCFKFVSAYLSDSSSMNLTVPTIITPESLFLVCQEMFSCQLFQ